MKRVIPRLFGATGICVAALGISVPAFAQQSPTQAWGSSTYFKSASQQSIDVYKAEAALKARDGGYGGNVSNSETNYFGTVTQNDYSAFQGPVVSSSNTNAVNYTAYQTHVDQSGSTGASSGVDYTTGNTAGSTNQGASTQTSLSGAGSTTQSAGR